MLPELKPLILLIILTIAISSSVGKLILNTLSINKMHPINIQDFNQRLHTVHQLSVNVLPKANAHLNNSSSHCGHTFQSIAVTI